MSGIVSESERILMNEFPVKPGNMVLITLDPIDIKHAVDEGKPWLGYVTEVFLRNHDPGVTVAIRTPEEFNELTGGVHSPVRLKCSDTMWARIVFAVPGGSVSKEFHTYELVVICLKTMN
ncbi:MAG: hypothetical protein UV01_C0001G0096 [Parcubacteria group bacterium GW2011_GWA2_42_14]|nr:MAG: hypothetical protein UV01_C0001G0096 [Parcubacteria group bacterium GW2011_GWA2_42_14]